MWLYARYPLIGGGGAIDLVHEGRTDEVLATVEGLDEHACLSLA
jgi:hypothetical protein